jgi:N-acyl-L-homoserine lactone synthetase
MANRTSFYCMAGAACHSGVPETAGVNRDELLELATDLARQAGTLALDMRTGVETLATKSSPTDVVTVADRAVERRLDRRTACWGRRGRLGPGQPASAGSSTRSTGPSTTCTAFPSGR